MRSLRVLSIVAACVGVVGSANAVILFSQPSDTAIGGTVIGSYSEALSQGGTSSSVTQADNFTVGSGGWNVSKIRFWGFSDAAGTPGYPDLTNFSAFEVNVLTISNTGVGTVIQGGVVPKASFTITPTGNVGGLGGYEYEFELNVNFNLAAGAYFLNVGAVEVAANGAGDWWAWSASDTGDDQFAFNSDFTSSGWNSFQGTNMAFEIEGDTVNAVPEPFTMALGLGAAGAYIRRRRRK